MLGWLLLGVGYWLFFKRFSLRCALLLALYSESSVLFLFFPAFPFSSLYVVIDVYTI